MDSDADNIIDRINI